MKGGVCCILDVGPRQPWTQRSSSGKIRFHETITSVSRAKVHAYDVHSLSHGLAGFNIQG